MRPGCLLPLSLLPPVLLLTSGIFAIARSESGAPGCSQAQCDAHAVAEPGDQCGAAGAVPANAPEAGRTSAMMLLQRQVASAQVSNAKGITEQALEATGAMELQQQPEQEHVSADGPPPLSPAAINESMGSQQPVSLMTLATEARQVRPVKGVKSVMLAAEDVEEFGSKGKTAPLNEIGYKSVAKMKNPREMEFFVKRAVADRGLYIVDEGSLKGLVPYYSGTKATQSFKALSNEIARAQKNKKKSWVTSTKPKTKTEPWEPTVGVSALGRKASVPSATFKTKGKNSAFVQTGTETSETRPEKKRHHSKESMVQTKAATSSWFLSLFSLMEGSAIYWLGARITLVAAAGSLLFGLFLFDESSHNARAEALVAEAFKAEDALVVEDGLPRLPPMSSGKDCPLTDKRPGAESLRPSVPLRPGAEVLASDPFVGAELLRPHDASTAPAARVSTVKMPAAVLQASGEALVLSSAVPAPGAADEVPLLLRVAEEASGNSAVATAAAPETEKEIQEPGAEPMLDEVVANTTAAAEVPRAAAAKAPTSEALSGAVEASDSPAAGSTAPEALVDLSLSQDCSSTHLHPGAEPLRPTSGSRAAS